MANTTSIKTGCAIALLASLFVLPATAEEAPAASGVQLEAELQKSNKELAAAQEKIAQLKTKLKASKLQANELEEQLFVVTDGKGMDDEEVAEVLPEGIYAWTENMRRMPVGVLFPKTATVPEGGVFGRISHISRNQTFSSNEAGDPADTMFGLEDGIKIGLLVGYGITKNLDVMIQRQNGRQFTRKVGDNPTYDLWDVMTKYKFMDEDKLWVDAALSLGTTMFLESNDETEFAGNAALLVEKSFAIKINDTTWGFRVGSGLLYTSLSTYESAGSAKAGAAPNKKYINEAIYPWEADQKRPARHTTAIPVSLSLALNTKHQLFGEAAFPIDGYETGNGRNGPSLTAGWRYNTPSHAYNIYLSNTANISFNSAFTGGYHRNDKLDLVGFDISIFF